MSTNYAYQPVEGQAGPPGGAAVPQAYAQPQPVASAPSPTQQYAPQQGGYVPPPQQAGYPQQPPPQVYAQGYPTQPPPGHYPPQAYAQPVPQGYVAHPAPPGHSGYAQHGYPAQPTHGGTPVVVVVNHGPKEVNHGVHCLLFLLCGGLWLPCWCAACCGCGCEQPCS